MAAPASPEIIVTLCYFDLFDFPLTKEELYRYLWRASAVSSVDFYRGLEESVARREVEFRDGYYTLPGRATIVGARQKALRLAEHKMQIARRVAKKLRWIPFVRAICVGNRVGALCPTENSDIDFLIIARAGRLWIARLLVLLVLDFFRLRPRPGRTADKICPCFFLSDQALDLSPVKIAPPDVYLTYWLTQLAPVYDQGGAHRALVAANAWVGACLPRGAEPYEPLGRWFVRDRLFGRLVKNFFEIAWQGGYGDIIESTAEKIQRARVAVAYGPDERKSGPAVVLSRAMLKFHKNDRREKYQAAWRERCRAFGVAV